MGDSLGPCLLECLPILRVPKVTLDADCVFAIMDLQLKGQLFRYSEYPGGTM